MAHTSIVLVGFGNVGQAFVRLLLRKRSQLKSKFGFTYQVNGIVTARHGAALSEHGLDLERALRQMQRGLPLDALSARPAPAETLSFIRACPADVLFENTPVNHENGQPAASYLRAALEAGMHAITANKGPVAHAYAELSQLAAAKGKRFLFESSVMDGAPIFSLFRGALPAVELRGFKGIFNSTSNLILNMMEEGNSFEEAVAHCQKIGLTETDPALDVDGWDAAIKVSTLSTVLLGVPLTPQQVERSGIRAITPAQIAEAKAAQERWKLVCSAYKTPQGVKAVVAPQRVNPDSTLYAINGSSSYIEFETDVLPGLGIVENNPGPETTAYGLLADLVNLMRGG